MDEVEEGKYPASIWIVQPIIPICRSVAQFLAHLILFCGRAAPISISIITNQATSLYR